MPNLFDEMMKLWPHGYSLFKVLQMKDIYKVAQYMAKYLGKSFDEVDRRFSKSINSYYSSKGLFRPVFVVDDVVVEFVSNSILKGKKKAYSSQYGSKLTGMIQYDRYYLDQSYLQSTWSMLTEMSMDNIMARYQSKNVLPPSKVKNVSKDKIKELWEL